MVENLFFDARYIRVDHHDGISRFSAGLASALADKVHLTALICDERQLALLPQGIDYRLIHAPTSPLEVFTAFKLNRLGAKVVFSPMQTIGSFGRKFKLILTLHDLIYYRHSTPPPSMPPLVRLGWRMFHLCYLPQRILLNAADAVATVSNTTADLIAKHRLTKRPVVVVYNAAGSEHPAAGARTEPATTDLIYMGSFMGYKNVETLVTGLASLPDARLHLLSRITDQRRAELSALAGEHQHRIVFHNGVTDHQYEELLASSFALVSASFDEGFGIPLAEAMAHGTPVVVSDIEIFHEIAGTAGTFFDPKSAKAFASAVDGLSGSAWTEASSRGVNQVQRFNWKASAKALLAAIEGL